MSHAAKPRRTPAEQADLEAELRADREKAAEHDATATLAELRSTIARWSDWGMTREDAKREVRGMSRILLELQADLDGPPPHDPQEHWNKHPMSSDIDDAIEAAKRFVSGPTERDARRHQLIRLVWNGVRGKGSKAEAHCACGVIIESPTRRQARRDHDDHRRFPAEDGGLSPAEHDAWPQGGAR